MGRYEVWVHDHDGSLVQVGQAVVMDDDKTIKLLIDKWPDIPFYCVPADWREEPKAFSKPAVISWETPDFVEEEHTQPMGSGSRSEYSLRAIR